MPASLFLIIGQARVRLFSACPAFPSGLALGDTRARAPPPRRQRQRIISRYLQVTHGQSPVLKATVGSATGGGGRGRVIPLYESQNKGGKPAHTHNRDTDRHYPQR